MSDSMWTLWSKLPSQVTVLIGTKGSFLMFAAARVMAAGKAGLESLPVFVDECIVQGVPLLAPWAADHSLEQINRLRDSTRQRQNTSWGDINYIGNAEIGFTIQHNTDQNRRLLHRINPLAAKSTMLADNPAQLAAWCRLRLDEHCHDTLAMWERFKYENGITDGQRLAVLIPYCPEGATSGTVGTYLGASLRKYFASEGLADELVVWGIELCPPIQLESADMMDQMGIQHAFRGFVARQELLGGLPVTSDPEDEDYISPFDITVAVDGGQSNTPQIEGEEIWYALDRGAAQITATLINGAAADDVAESTAMLMNGRRWNAILTHVVSELDYDAHCRYLRYHRNLPWYRARDVWATADVAARCDAFLRRTDEMREWINEEPLTTVRERVELLLLRANELRDIKEEKILGIFPKRREANSKRQQLLNFALDEDQESNDFLMEISGPPGRMVPKRDPFCINVVLPANLRQQAADKAREGGAKVTLTDLLGDSGTYQVREHIARLLTDVLKRADCAPVDIDSQARFQSLIAISIENRATGQNNDALRPSQDILRDFIDANNRELPGSLNLRVYDLDQYVEKPSISGQAGTSRNKVLGWQPPKDVDFDIPVEYSLLTLARCRPENGFSDVSTHDEIKAQHDALVADKSRHEEFARYYSIRLPDELRTGEDEG